MDTINEITETKILSKITKLALKLNTLKSKRKRFILKQQRPDEVGIETTLEEIAEVKLKLENQTAKLHEAKMKNKDANYQRDQAIKKLEDNILNISEKFDRFLRTQLEVGEIKVD